MSSKEYVLKNAAVNNKNMVQVGPHTFVTLEALKRAIENYNNKMGKKILYICYNNDFEPIVMCNLLPEDRAKIKLSGCGMPVTDEEVIKFLSESLPKGISWSVSDESK